MTDLYVDANLVNNTTDSFTCQNPENLDRYEKVLKPGWSAEYARDSTDAGSLNGHIDFTTSTSDGQVQLSIAYNYAAGTLVPTLCNGGERKYSISPPAGTFDPANGALQGVFTISVL